MHMDLFHGTSIKIGMSHKKIKQKLQMVNIYNECKY